MGTVDELYQDVARLRLRDEVPELVRETGNVIADKIQGQLIKGEQSTGEKIQPNYKSSYYSSIKLSMNSTPGYGIPDLKYTGEYYKNIEVVVLNPEEYAIVSAVPYANKPSIEQYGDNILRLSEQSKDEYVEETLRPKIEQYITDITGLTFE